MQPEERPLKEISRLDSPWSRQTPLDPKLIMKTQGSLETHDRDYPRTRLREIGVLLQILIG